MENNIDVLCNILNDVKKKEEESENYQSFKQELDFANKEALNSFIKKNLLILAEEYILPEEKRAKEQCCVCKEHLADYIIDKKIYCEDCFLELLSAVYKVKPGKTFTYTDNNPRSQRPNELCKCGSGKKYKKCCGKF